MEDTESFMLSLEGTHTSETVNPTSYTRQYMHSQVNHFPTGKKGTTHQL